MYFDVFVHELQKKFVDKSICPRTFSECLDKYGKIRKFGKGFCVQNQFKGSIPGQKVRGQAKKNHVRAQTRVREQNKERPNHVVSYCYGL